MDLMTLAIAKQLSGGDSSSGESINYIYVPRNTSLDGYILDLSPYGITDVSQIKYIECSGGTITYVNKLQVYQNQSTNGLVPYTAEFKIGSYNLKRGLGCYYNGSTSPMGSIWNKGFILGY